MQPFFMTAQRVENIRYEIREDTFVITYNLLSAYPGDRYRVSLEHCRQKWVDNFYPVTDAYGAIGPDQVPGYAKQIIWVLKRDERYLTRRPARFRVTAVLTTDGEPKPPALPDSQILARNVLAQRIIKQNTIYAEESRTENYPSPDPFFKDMVAINGGTFQMGSIEGDLDEKPVHSVTVQGFWIGKHEVTQAQWRAVMGTNPSYFKDCDQCPVEQVSWNDVQEFIQKLNAKTGHTYRLPTEAEWEYAAGGGNSNRTSYAGSNNESSLGSYAWYSANSGDKTQLVGQKQPNGLGLYDMSGNVWEWCEDVYGDYPAEGQINPKGPEQGVNRVLRGGSWDDDAKDCRVSYRYYTGQDGRYYDGGFRLARQF